MTGGWGSGHWGVMRWGIRDGDVSMYGAIDITYIDARTGPAPLNASAVPGFVGGASVAAPITLNASYVPSHGLGGSP